MAINTSDHKLDLNAHSDGRITHVTVCPDCAKITRAFHLKLEPGSTGITIKGGLAYIKDPPKVLRLEKHGDITLRDVKITTRSSNATNVKAVDEASLKALMKEKDLLRESFARCQLAPALLTKFLESMDLKKMTIGSLAETLETYDEQVTKWGNRMRSLEKEIFDIDEKIQQGKDPALAAAEPSPENPSFSEHVIQFSVDAVEATDAEVWLIYAASGASWTADYDIAVNAIRSVDTEARVTITYRAVVENNTPESWNDVKLALETMPLSNQGSEIADWKSYYQHYQQPSGSGSAEVVPNAIHSVVGTVTIPKWTSSSKILVAQFEPRVLFERYCTPSITSQVKLRGKITNNGEYPMCAGNASIYSGGDFLQSTRLSPVVVGAAFEVPLGSDPTIQVRYPHFTVKTTKTSETYGYSTYWWTRHHCERQITITNTRKTEIPSLTVIDNYPKNAGLIWPSLPLESPESVVITGIPEGSHVVAGWDRVAHPVKDAKELGSTKIVNWVCTVGAQSEIRLDLRWYVQVDRMTDVKVFG